MSAFICDFCGSASLSQGYRAENSQRGLSIYVCQDCSLVQSLPRIDHVASRAVAASGEADWGNIRYGKGFRTETAFRFLEGHLNWEKLKDILDIGSSRGHFILKLVERAPAANAYGIEPDPTIVEPYRNLPGLTFYQERLEHIHFPDASFDFIYCSHTLEHLASPKKSLAQIRNWLRPDGLLFVEVPDLDFIKRADLVEEWFIDKHLYHFSAPNLEAYLQQAGLGVVQRFPDSQNQNLSYLVKPTQTPNALDVRPFNEQAEGDMAKYRRTLEINRHHLREVAHRIAELLPKRIVVWGAGRIFDCLVKYGGLRPDSLAGVIDAHLGDYVDQVHGLPICKPEQIVSLNPEIVLIASRSFEAEIRTQIKALLEPHPHMMGLDTFFGV